LELIAFEAKRLRIFVNHFPAFLPNLFIFKEKIKRIFPPVRAKRETI